MDHPALHEFIVDRVNVGIVVLERDLTVRVWNHFMAMHSGHAATQVVGRNLLEFFPEIPPRWLAKKVESVFILKNYAFTTWQQRPYLFRFRHNRPVTADIDYMRQDCTFIPIRNAGGDVDCICLTVADVTDTSIYQSRLQEALDAMAEMSIRDSLTCLNNRHHLEVTLATEFDRVRRHGGRLSVLMFDVDHFKVVNDSHGHQVGDDVLKMIACRVRELLRSSDMAARYGGEEFTLVLPNTDLEGARQLAERLRGSIAQQAMEFEGFTVAVTVTIGVSELRADTANHEVLLNEADKALYRGKGEGRNRVVVYRPEQDTD